MVSKKCGFNFDIQGFWSLMDPKNQGKLNFK